MKSLLIVTILVLFAALPASGFAAAAKCKDFDTQAQAQKFHKDKGSGWKRLDGDKDGEA